MTVEMPARLLCGADPDELLEQAADTPGVLLTAHHQGCVHCQAALAEFDHLLAPLRLLAAESVRPPPHLLEQVLARIRSAVANPAWAVLDDGDGYRHDDRDRDPDRGAARGAASGGSRGRTRVAAHVVVEVARVAAGTVPGVRVALAAQDPGAEDPAAPGPAAWGPAVEVGASGSTVAVRVTVAADYGEDLHELGRRIDRAVGEQVYALVGVEVATVTVHVDDVLDR